MSKASDRRKAQENQGDASAQSAAPVAATEASSSAPAEGDTTVDDGETSNSDDTVDDGESTAEVSTQSAELQAEDGTAPAPAAEGESVKGDISVASTKKPKAEKVPSFVPNQAERTRLQAMSNDELRTEAGDRVSSVGANDFRVFQIDDSKELVDQIVGSALERSGIRAGVIDFLRSRTGDNAVTTKDSTFETAAVGWAIASYMVLAMAGGVVKGKFDQGYLAARGNDVKRGMVARKQLRIVADLTPAPVAETKAEEAPTPAAE